MELGAQWSARRHGHSMPRPGYGPGCSKVFKLYEAIRTAYGYSLLFLANQGHSSKLNSVQHVVSHMSLFNGAGSFESASQKLVKYTVRPVARQDVKLAGYR